MAVRSGVSVEEYLHTSYRPDCDYVDGEVQERNLGELEHGITQSEIVVYLRSRYPRLKRRVITELRVQVKPTRFRIPDVCVLAEDALRGNGSSRSRQCSALRFSLQRIEWPGILIA
jgi:hypothetical protein